MTEKMEAANNIKLLSLPYMAALLVLKRYPEFKSEIRECAKFETELFHVQETIIQTYLFDGYPTALEGLIILKEIMGDKYQSQPEESLSGLNLEKWLKNGEYSCRKIYADNYEKLVKNVIRLSPDLANWMLYEGYGKVLSRKGLDLTIREMINVAILSVKDYPRQLHSHLKGAVNVGVSRENVEILFRKLLPLCPEKIKKAIDLWRKIAEDKL